MEKLDIPTMITYGIEDTGAASDYEERVARIQPNTVKLVSLPYQNFHFLRQNEETGRYFRFNEFNF